MNDVMNRRINEGWGLRDAENRFVDQNLDWDHSHQGTLNCGEMQECKKRKYRIWDGIWGISVSEFVARSTVSGNV